MILWLKIPCKNEQKCFFTWQQARKNAPSIVFIDEIDAVGRVRGGAMGNDERDQTVNQLLSELDGFSNKDADVVVMAATNRRDVLDPALIRSGRFDRIVQVGLPDFNGRIETLEVGLCIMCLIFVCCITEQGNFSFLHLSFGCSWY